MRIVSWLCPVAIYLLLIACSTPSTTYYILTANAEEPINTCPCSIGIGPITLSDYLDRPQLISTNGNTLTLNQYHRWAESIESGMSRVILENLVVLNNTSNVTLFPWSREEAPDYRVKVHIIELSYQNSSCDIKVNWRLENRDKQVVQSGLELFTGSSGEAGQKGVASSCSDALLKLSKQVATHIPDKSGS